MTNNRRHGRVVIVGVGALMAAALTACGGGGGGGGVAPASAPAPVAVRYAIGGTVSGLGQGAAVTLDNAGEKLKLSANGSFAFATKLDNGASYNVSIADAAGANCSVSNGSGSVAGADVTKVAVACTSTVIAGAEAVLKMPSSLLADAAGNIYALDIAREVILKITPGGAVSTLAGANGATGNRDGSGAAARFNFGSPSSMVLASDGNLVVTDTCNGTVRKVTPAGAVTTIAGSKGGACNNVMPASPPVSRDGTGTDAQFVAPGPIINDGAGGFILLDSFAAATVRRMSASGVVTTTVWPHDASTTQSLSSIVSVARDAGGVVYLADWNEHIWKIVDGTPVFVAGSRYYAGSNHSQPNDGSGAAAEFSDIAAIVVGADGNLYVADASMVRKVTPAGAVTTIAGSMTRGASDGSGTAAQFGQLFSIALAPDGSLLAVDYGQTTIRRITTAGVVTTLSATPALRGYADGTGGAARLNSTGQIAADPQGNVYLADPLQNVVRKITPAGEVSLLAGVRGVKGELDGPPASATFTGPAAVAAGPGGVLYVAEQTGLRRIADGAVSTVSPSVKVRQMAVDGDGSVAVSSGAAVYRYTAAGVATTLVSADMVAAVLQKPVAEVTFVPRALVFDAAGNLYVSDTGTVAVYKLSKSGTLSLFAGTPLVEAGNVDGAPGTATLGYYLNDYMAIDSHGDLYLSGQGLLRKISPDGVVSTPPMGWGDAVVYGLAYGNGKLFGFTPYAVLQTPVP